MRRRFSALGNGLSPECGCQTQHTFGHGPLLRVVQHVTNKAWVDLGGWGQQAFEVGPRQKSRAEIVQCPTHTPGGALCDDTGHQAGVLPRTGFQHPQLQRPGLGLRVARQARFQGLREAGGVLHSARSG